MKQIYKIGIPIDIRTVNATNSFYLPRNSRFLHVREQHESLCAWFEVDDTNPSIQYSFQVFGTGHGPIGDNLQYLGTGIFAEGDLVLHLYQVCG